MELTSLNACKLSQTFVPLIRDTWRSDVSPPKITKTLRTSLVLGNASISCEDFDLLGKRFDRLVYDARFGNRKQAR